MKRYDPGTEHEPYSGDYPCMDECPVGEYVSYNDAMEIINKLTEELQECRNGETTTECTSTQQGGV